MGEPVIDGIEVIDLIGRGAFSTVYAAVEPRLGRKVAVKVVDIDAADLERRRRFERECILIGRLAAHPNVVSVFSQGVTREDRPYLVMELCPAGSLRAELAGRGMFAPTEVLEIGVALSGALETAHLEGVLHRDLKPENILIGADGAPKVGDFGIATLAAGASSTTTTAMTPVHAAPELFEGRPASIRSDVYSLGSTLFTLLEGRPPITLELGELASFVGRAARQTRPSVGVRVPSQLAALIAELLSIDPQERPGTMVEIGHRLRAIQMSLGEQRTPMVVIEPATETVDVGPGAGPASTTEEPGAPVGSSLAQPIGAAAPSSRWRRGAAIAAVIGVIAASFGIGVWTGHDSEAATGTTTSTVPPTTVPVGPAGIGGVDVDWSDPRPSGEVTKELMITHDPSLAGSTSIPLEMITELGLALDPELAATPVELRKPIPRPPIDQPYDYPVRLVMDFLNPVSFSTGACRGFKSSLLGMVDARYMLFSLSTIIVAYELDTVEHAHEEWLGTALLMGITADQCSGFDDDGWPTDRSAMSVERNDLGLALPDGIDEMVTGTTTDHAIGFILRRGTVVTYLRMPGAGVEDPVAAVTPLLAAVSKAMVDQTPA